MSVVVMKKRDGFRKRVLAFLAVSAFDDDADIGSVGLPRDAFEIAEREEEQIGRHCRLVAK